MEIKKNMVVTPMQGSVLVTSVIAQPATQLDGGTFVIVEISDKDKDLKGIVGKTCIAWSSTHVSEKYHLVRVADIVGLIDKIGG